MNFHYSTASSSRSRTTPYFRQQLGEQRLPLRTGNRLLWFAVVKQILFLGPFLLALGLWLAGLNRDIDHSLTLAQNARNGLLLTRTDLQAQHDRLSSPERIRRLAASKLSLHVPKEEQIQHVAKPGAAQNHPQTSRDDNHYLAQLEGKFDWSSIRDVTRTIGITGEYGKEQEVAWPQ